MVLQLKASRLAQQKCRRLYRIIDNRFKMFRWHEALPLSTMWRMDPGMETFDIDANQGARSSDQVHDALADGITTGVLEPGQRIVETNLARKFGVSQAPVREALRRLESAGMVPRLERRGSSRHAYEVRSALEPLAAQANCRNRTDADLKVLQRILTEMTKAAEADNLKALIDLDMAFHRHLWEASGNRILQMTWPIIETSLRSFTLVSNRQYFNALSEIVASHVPLLEAVRQRDTDLAARLFQEHSVAVWEAFENAEP